MSIRSFVIAAHVLALAACSKGGGASAPTGDRIVIDRFSAAAGHLMVRTDGNHLPAPDQPIDFDRPPFLTQGLTASGTPVRYYNFDVQPCDPAPLYRLVHPGSLDPIPGQPDIVDAVPGERGYNDFWLIHTVEVPADFAPGSITSAGALHARGWPEYATSQIVDCPIVPRGSTARGGDGVVPPKFRELFVRGARVPCIEFAPILVEDRGHVPTSPIYVTFARNPGGEGGGPESGFRTEPDGGAPLAQTHNVLFSIPGDAEYSPLWAVKIYDRADFEHVHDAESALRAKMLNDHGPLVNCPVTEIAGTGAGSAAK